MSKKSFRFVLLLTFTFVIFLFANNLQAQEPVPVTNPGPVSPTTSPATPAPATPAPVSTQPTSAILISELGDLNIGEVKEVTVPGLKPGSKYYWAESKVTSVIPIKGYTTFFTDCYDADSNGKITRNLGPYSMPGFYHLAISKVDTSGRCSPSGNPLAVSPPEFSVGGPTGDSCCYDPITSAFAVYDRKKDACTTKLIPDILPLQPNPQRETVCKKKDTFCEPESLQCFKNKTFVVGGKICKTLEESKDPAKFDPNKNAVCGSVGGQEQQCGTDQDSAIQTAIGCIHTSPAGFIKDTMKFVIAISGGLAFLLMLLGAFQMLTSAGNPETLQAGRERLQNAIIGLLFVIFAVLLLRIIGVDILGLGEQFGFK